MDTVKLPLLMLSVNLFFTCLLVAFFDLVPNSCMSPNLCATKQEPQKSPSSSASFNRRGILILPDLISPKVFSPRSLLSSDVRAGFISSRLKPFALIKTRDICLSRLKCSQVFYLVTLAHVCSY